MKIVNQLLFSSWIVCAMCACTNEDKLLSGVDLAAQQYPEEYKRICAATHFDYEGETPLWRDIIEHMYLPQDAEKGIFVQNDGFMDKVLQTTDAIPQAERPINQHWSWDRILRSCYIKQSDVLLGLYLYYFLFDTETVRRNFDFYEPMTVHESSLSPHIHAILAARIGETEKAYQLFVHATRMDLDDYNNEADQGLHITSMPGSWLAIVRGFANLQTQANELSLSPIRPSQWEKYAFRINFQGRKLKIEISTKIQITLLAGETLNVKIYDVDYQLTPEQPLCIACNG